MNENNVSKYVLGINAYDHDVSACLLRNGEIAVAIEKERITRVKHDTGFYQEVVEYCLDAAGITLEQVGTIVWNCYVLPVSKLEQRLSHHDWPSYLNPRERAQAPLHPLYLGNSRAPVEISHHLAHAYSAFAASPFEDGVVMIVDGVGSYRMDVTEPVPAGDETHALSRESESYYRFSGSNLDTLKKVWLEPAPGLMNDEFYNMAGLGALYSRASTYIFQDWDKCGEVMGLAPYGRPENAPQMLTFENGVLDVPEWDAKYPHPCIGLSDVQWENSKWRTEWEDIAWRVQDDTERVLLERAQWLHEATGSPNLCIAGGVALNCVANGRIARESPFENVWIQPAAGDNGIAIGCALYGHIAVNKRPRTFVMHDAYLGKQYGRDDEEKALGPIHVRLASSQRRCDDVASKSADALASGMVVGWFQERSEFGPRALGNRSILADPRKASMKDHLNARVKFRQAFRPFAPAVMAERAQEIFEGTHASPYMLLATGVKEEWRDRVAAIVHVDGSARIQTVGREYNPRFHALLAAFAERTGVPVLLNTSFNIKGEPIVESPVDAIQCFLNTDIDVLVIHDIVLRKNLIYRVFKPLIRFIERARLNYRSESVLEKSLGGG